MYQYRGFGLNISSEIAFPELYPIAADHTDVTIRIGEIPVVPEGISFATKNVSYISNEREMHFIAKDIASYYAVNGDSITICPAEGNTDTHIMRLFVLGGAMAGILQQRKQVPLHTAAIIKDGELVLICGQSGAGKSTTLATLIKQGYTVFSDDITVLQQTEQQIMGRASYPMIKLWEHSIELLDHASFSNRSYKIMPHLEKYGVFFHDNFNTQPFPISKIFLLQVNDTDHIQSKQLSGSTAFTEVMQHIYKPQLFNQPALRACSFQTISSLVQQAEVYHIGRPANCLPEHLVAAITAFI